MLPLKQRSALEGREWHKTLGVRVYETDAAQSGRIERSRRMLDRTIASFSDKQWPLEILELGCGTGDISGPQHAVHRVSGSDINKAAIEEAHRRFPLGNWAVEPIDTIEPSLPRDIIILCEVLEHLENPIEMIGRWLPWCEQAIISHPVDEPAHCDLSNGDHQWRFDRCDLLRWADLGGHVTLEREIFSMGGYTCGLVRTRRRHPKV